MAMALAVLIQAQKTEAVKVEYEGFRVLLFSVLVREGCAQPGIGTGMSFALVLIGVTGVFLLVLVVLRFLGCFGAFLVQGEPRPLSPRERREQPSSSWETPQSSMGLSEAIQDNPVSFRNHGEAREPSTARTTADEHCEFPLVGRLDPRSNWEPLHYLRGLLSLVGGSMFQYLGVDGVEIWLLRAVGRTFRYGVAFAYERARGVRLTDGTGRGVPVYDISQARWQPPMQENDDDPTIDQVQHVDVDPRKDYGPQLQDLQLWEVASVSSSDLLGEGSESSEESTRLSTEVDGAMDVPGIMEPPEGEPEVADVELAGTEGAYGSSSGGVGYRALDGALIVIYGDDELRVELPG